MSSLSDAFETESERQAARAALAAARLDTEPVECRPLGRGNRKETALVTLADGERAVVQLSDDERALRTERLLLDAVGDRTAVPVPDVLAAERTGDVAALIRAYVDAGDLHRRFVELARSTQRGLARSFGRFLAELHETFRFDGYGEVVVADTATTVGTVDTAGVATPGGSLVGTDDDWADWLMTYGRAGLGRLPAAFDGLRPDLAALFEDASLASAPSARLFPWDFRPGNALVADGEVAAVLDWESPLAAVPALSVAKAEYLVADWYVADPDPLRTAFAAGYESVRPLPAVEPVHRAAAVCQTAVDSTGTVTNPGYPEFDREAAVAFHRRALERVLDGER